MQNTPEDRQAGRAVFIIIITPSRLRLGTGVRVVKIIKRTTEPP